MFETTAIMFLLGRIKPLSGIYEFQISTNGLPQPPGVHEVNNLFRMRNLIIFLLFLCMDGSIKSTSLT
ncbi:hypothetical protein L861_16520 [Litchfieldella anticariensis FP35 = DSM 16096]|uniref:Uncharacterized protein n=1 Tax=Litchfieldella anticariensis (strain DSM 16096 / CECT 5854 / CIP 108499 / LMG 22089 / FP35) TaxID=1121939 RepID=S2KHK8_LITA3|nr:hypothetical protein L861_16520 [Halomonas anticariensis FP35 = DSM 16096]